MPQPSTSSSVSRVPALSIQRLVWHDHGRAPGFFLVFRIAHAGSRHALVASLTRLVARHDILQCHLRQEADELVIVRSASCPTPEVVWLDEALDDATLADRFRDFAERPFRLTEAPLFRVIAARTARHTVRVGVVFHHLIYDRPTLRAFPEEWEMVLAGHEASAPAPSWLAWAAGRPVAQPDEVAWWRSELAGAAWPLWVPHPGAPPTNRMVSAPSIAHELSAFPSLRAATQEEAYARFFGTWIEALRAFVQSDDILCAVVTSFREERLPMGPMVDDLLVRVRVDSTNTVLTAARRAWLAATEHRCVPYTDQLRQLDASVVERLAVVGPCPVLFTFLDERQPLSRALPSPGIETVDAYKPSQERPYDYFAHVRCTAAGFELVVRVQAGRVGQAAANALVQAWSGALVAAEP